MCPRLPDDILHLICTQLSYQKDFGTLFRCTLVSKQLALLAARQLYRIHDVAPVTNGGDEIEISRIPRSDDLLRAQQPDQILTNVIAKWANLWRTLILSSLGQTTYPYCSYIRALDLRDLKELLEDFKFRGAISERFFDGELAQFCLQLEHPAKLGRKAPRTVRWNTVGMLDAIGEAISKKTIVVEELSGEISCEALIRWIPRLPRLQHMTLWRGAALANGVGDLIKLHCPSFKSLVFYQWMDPDTDHSMADFLTSIRPHSLESLDIISHSEMGAESFAALNSHSESLIELRLNNIRPEAVSTLSLMKGCTSLTSLLISERNAHTDLEKENHSVFLDVVDWLKNCKNLNSITFHKMLSASAILTPVLLDNSIRLVKLELEGRLSRNFLKALAHQDSLESVWLRGDGEEFIGEDIAVVVESLINLTNLKDLRLRDMSDFFRNEHLCTIARHLLNLEELWTSGYGITDAIWPDVALLKSLRRLEVNAWSSFTADGLFGYINQLGSGNSRMILGINMADPETSLSEVDHALVREALASQVEGKFDYILARDLNVSEFDDSGSD